MIKSTDILCLHFYDYKTAFTGSEGDLCYRITKEDQEDENGKKESYLKVVAWKGPYAFDHTQEKKTEKRFPFSPEGQENAVEWLNEEHTSIDDNLES